MGLTSWDLQTGGPVSTIHSGSKHRASQRFSSTYSMDGKVVAVASGGFTNTTITAYNLLSGTPTSYNVSEGQVVDPIWTYGECLQFATIKPGSIIIWETNFTLTHKPAEVKSLPAPDNITDARPICSSHSFLACLYP
jgi:hypothetical protein